MERTHDMGPKEDPGDHTVVIRAHLHWKGSVGDVLGSPAGSAVGHVSRQPDGAWQLAFAVQRGPKKRQRHFVSVDPDATRKDRWHLQKLGPGVWDVTPSIFFEGQFHGFVTLIGVPEPAPWC